MQLKTSILDALAIKVPGVPLGNSVGAAYNALAIHFGAHRDAMMLSPKEQQKVLRRLACNTKGEPTKDDFEAQSARSILSLQGARLRALDNITGALSKAQRKQERRMKARQARRDEVRDARQFVASLSLPVSRVAGQAEHLAVLAGLPDAAFRRTPEWRRTRYQAIAMAGSACAHCGRGPKDGAVLEARHIVSRIAAPARAFDLFNIRVACLDCATGKRTLVASKAGLPDQDGPHRR